MGSRRELWIILGVVVGAGTLVAVVAGAAPPTQVSYQGQLKAGGALFTGTATMKFAIVDGTTSLWSNDSTSVGGTQPTGSVTVQVVNGIFSVQLGAAPVMKPISAQAIEGAASPILRVWVSTNGGSTFDQLTDQPLTSVPFSLQSQSDGSWNEGGGNVYRLGGNVGIGTAAPETKLHIKGDNVSPSNARIILANAAGDKWFLNTANSTNRFAIGRVGIRDDLVVDSNGKVGIGTSSPGNVFDVIGGVAFQGNHVYIRNQSSPTGHQTWGFVISSADGHLGLGRATDVPPSGGTLTAQVVALDENAPANSLIINSAGQTSVKVLQITGGSDLAEPFDVSAVAGDSKVEEGMVVAIDPARPGELRLATEPYDATVAGVVSGAKGLLPGMVMKSAGDKMTDGKHPVALSGRVWCWVDASFGSVRPGDLLTTSSTPGMAMRASDPTRRSGAVLGKAMTPLDSGRGLVLVLVSLQ